VPKWTVADVPPQSGRVAVLAGLDPALAARVAAALVNAGATVVPARGARTGAPVPGAAGRLAALDLLVAAADPPDRLAALTGALLGALEASPGPRVVAVVDDLDGAGARWAAALQRRALAAGSALRSITARPGAGPRRALPVLFAATAADVPGGGVVAPAGPVGRWSGPGLVRPHAAPGLARRRT
jgi:hypothetical protein